MPTITRFIWGDCDVLLAEGLQGMMSKNTGNNSVALRDNHTNKHVCYLNYLSISVKFSSTVQRQGP